MRVFLLYFTYVFILLQVSSTLLLGQTSDTIRVDSISFVVVEKDETGTRISRERYVNMELHGLSTTSLYDGKKEMILSLKNYSRGKREGLHSAYWANGKLKVEVAYVDGLRSGPTIEYWSKGGRSLIENYCHGIPCGEWRFYDKKCNLYLIEIYNEGIYAGGFFYDKGFNLVAEVEADEKGEFIRKIFYSKDGIVYKVQKEVDWADARSLHP